MGSKRQEPTTSPAGAVNPNSPSASPAVPAGSPTSSAVTGTNQPPVIVTKSAITPSNATPCPSATSLLCQASGTATVTFIEVYITDYNATSTVVSATYSTYVPPPSSASAGSSTTSVATSSPGSPSSSEPTSSTASTSAGASGADSSSSTSPSPTHTTAPSKKNDAGALAGAAIGGIVAGALIAGLIAFFLLKKRSRKDRYVSRNTYVPAASPAYGGEKGTPMVSIASAGTMDFLPQQADDAEVSRKISTVVDQIDQHVENFYANRGAPMDANREAEISRFETSELPLPLAACFQNSGAPMTLIKHCLAYHIFNLTMSPSEHGLPLLPAEMAGVVTAMYHKSLSPAASKDTITAFSTWKSLTRYLRPDLGRDASTARTLSESSAHFATHFTNVFSPWAHAQYSNDTRARHLTELTNQAVHTAIWLFGQPDNYKFEWDVPNTRQNANYSAVIIPAVWKTTHGGTRLNGKGQNVLSPAIKGF